MWWLGAGSRRGLSTISRAYFSTKQGHQVNCIDWKVAVGIATVCYMVLGCSVQQTPLPESDDDEGFGIRLSDIIPECEETDNAYSSTGEHTQKEVDSCHVGQKLRIGEFCIYDGGRFWVDKSRACHRSRTSIQCNNRSGRAGCMTIIPDGRSPIHYVERRDRYAERRELAASPPHECILYDGGFCANPVGVRRWRIERI